MTKFVYKIKNTKDDTYFAGYLRNNFSFKSTPKMYKSESSASQAINWLIASHIGKKTFKSGVPSLDEAKKLIPYDLELIKEKVEHTVVSQVNMDSLISNDLIRRKLHSHGYQYSAFWLNSIAKEYDADIHYIFEINQTKGVPNKVKMKESRELLKNIGIKGRSYREYAGMFGFVDKDQAMKARLTLDVKSFIDLDAVRAEINNEKSSCTAQL